MRIELINTISGKGTAAGQFEAVLRGIAVDTNGLLYAVGDRAVNVFDAHGKLVRSWKTARPGYCISIDEKSELWLGESGQVERFDAQGNQLGALRDGERLGTVTAVAFWKDNVLVADATGRCVRRYERAGTWLNDVGNKNNTQGFVIPNGYLDMRVDVAGVIHAVNPARHRIERYKLDGELLGHFGKFGMQQPEDFGGCCNPTNMALLPNGCLVVTEKAPPRLKVYDAQDKVAAIIKADAFDPQCKNMSLAVDRQGRIYVVDTERLCVLVFAPQGPTTTTAADDSGRRAEVKP